MPIYTMPPINIARMTAAFETTPLCRGDWCHRPVDGPTRLCAISALVHYAGVSVDLIHLLQYNSSPEVEQMGVKYVSQHPLWVNALAFPVLEAYYHIPVRIAAGFVKIFDGAATEALGVASVLAVCEQHNAQLRVEEAAFIASLPKSNAVTFAMAKAMKAKMFHVGDEITFAPSQGVKTL